MRKHTTSQNQKPDAAKFAHLRAKFEGDKRRTFNMYSQLYYYLNVGTFSYLP